MLFQIFNLYRYTTFDVAYSTSLALNRLWAAHNYGTRVAASEVEAKTKGREHEAPARKLQLERRELIRKREEQLLLRRQRGVVQVEYS
jgi:hypothetical protein